MAKPFSNSLLLCTDKYSLYNSFLEILNELSVVTRGYNIRQKINPVYFKMQTQMFRLPFKIRNAWEKRLLIMANNHLLEEINTFKPNLVFVYNSEYLLPETCAEIKKHATLIFFMGDSPFFTPTNPYYLTCLTYADLILSPDTFWISQLNTLGIQNVSFFVPGLDITSYYIIDNKEALRDIACRDVLYAGSCYVNSWGYKKALLMAQFTGFNFKLYGSGSWKRWFRFFPELESHYIESGYIPTGHLNNMFNKSKLMPVDGNPAILNGFHLRLFEALGAGVLPLVEDRKDVKEKLFNNSGLMVPIITDYQKAGKLAEYYLKNENERKELTLALREFILIQYCAKNNSERLMMLLKEFS